MFLSMSLSPIWCMYDLRHYLSTSVPKKKSVPFNTLFGLVSRINVVLEQVLQPCRRSTAKDGNRHELPNLQVNCCVPQPHHAGVQVIRAHWIWFTISF